MTVKTEKFLFRDIEWSYSESREIRPDPVPPVRTSVQTVTAVCKSCTHVWSARQYGEGKLREALGTVIVSCPECHAVEHVPVRALKQSDAD